MRRQKKLLVKCNATPHFNFLGPDMPSHISAYLGASFACSNQIDFIQASMFTLLVKMLTPPIISLGPFCHPVKL